MHIKATLLKFGAMLCIIMYLNVGPHFGHSNLNRSSEDPLLCGKCRLFAQGHLAPLQRPEHGVVLDRAAVGLHEAAVPVARRAGGMGAAEHVAGRGPGAQGWGFVQPGGDRNVASSLVWPQINKIWIKFQKIDLRAQEVEYVFSVMFI